MQFRHPRAVALLFAGVLIGTQAAFWLLPHRSFSQNEKRVLAQKLLSVQRASRTAACFRTWNGICPIISRDEMDGWA